MSALEWQFHSHLGEVVTNQDTECVDWFEWPQSISNSGLHLGIWVVVVLKPQSKVDRPFSWFVYALRRKGKKKTEQKIKDQRIIEC